MLNYIGNRGTAHHHLPGVGGPHRIANS
ncbi:hypothetical protein VN97_g13285, partial [Penicillium thymicola]